MSDPIASISAVSSASATGWRAGAAAQPRRSDPSESAANPAAETASQKTARERTQAEAAAARRNPTPMGRLLDVVA